MSMIGKTLGNFECIALLGKGGMGEVYQAKDTKLGRDVAIKVLPEEFAKDIDRVARFQREAKLLASLNHPNIAAIYGLEESDGTHFLVLELVEGDTLADRIKGGAIPVEESLKLSLQIAEALEAAHEKGVIHRDLKPANIKVTSEGKVKVLDFGLAKAYAGEQAEVDLSQSPTLSQAATQKGIILGTAAYMSPEQASGEAVDKRADIWAFGVVLFEMLTGRSLFEGNNVSQTLARVLEREPDFSTLPPNLHPRIRLLLERCLEKQAKNRYSSISDARVDIQKVLADPSGVFAQPSVLTKPRKQLQLSLPRVMAIAILCLIIASVAGWLLKPPEPKQVMRFDYDLPEGQEFAPIVSPVTISRDGTKIVYVANNQLYLRDINQLTARPIQGSDDNPMSPFFSPNGRQIGYFSMADSQLKRIDITGGTPVPICQAVLITSASWGEDETILFSSTGGGIMQVSADGGTPEAIVTPEENETLLSPQILPDGKSILFTVMTRDSSLESVPQVVVQSLKSGDRKNLYLPGAPAQYLPTGHLVYAVDNNLFAIPFDLDRLEPTGGAVPMVEGVFRQTNSMPTASAISDSGTLVYLPGTMPATTLRTFKLNLVWVDQQGNVEEIAADPDDYDTPSLSPDGTKVAVTKYNEEGSSDIHILDLNGETQMRLTFNENSTDPLWTTDGQRVVFMAGEGDERGIYWKAADGRGKEELLALMSNGGGPPWSWADDGKTLVTTKSPLSLGGGRGPSPAMMRRMMRGRGSGLPRRSSGSEGSSTSEEMRISTDIGTISMEGDHKWQQLLHLPGSFVSALQISPDGRWMAYGSFEIESGQGGVFVRPFSDVEEGGRWQVPGGARNCLWSPSGQELFYFNTEDGSLMAIEVETEPTFQFGKSKVLFNPGEIGLNLGNILRGSINISPDGKRFLMTKLADTADDESQVEASPLEALRKIIFVVNWFEELKDRVKVE